MQNAHKGLIEKGNPARIVAVLLPIHIMSFRFKPIHFRHPLTPAPSALPSTHPSRLNRGIALRWALAAIGLAAGGLLLAGHAGSSEIRYQAAKDAVPLHGMITVVPKAKTELADQLPLEPTLAPRQAASREDLLASRIEAKFKVNRPLARLIIASAHEAGNRYQVDPILLLAMAGVESSFNPYAKNPSGALGLTQVIPRWHPEKVAYFSRQGKTLTDPATSLNVGAWVFSEYRKKHGGNRMRALQQYNGSIKDKKQRYASKVLLLYRSLNANLPAPQAEPSNALAWANTSPQWLASLERL